MSKEQLHMRLQNIVDFSCQVHSIHSAVSVQSSSSSSFFVPAFLESEVESYFDVFEYIAATFHWSEDVRAILLHCNLTERVQEGCSSLSEEYELINDMVKAKLSLMPEACIQCFCKL